MHRRFMIRIVAIVALTTVAALGACTSHSTTSAATSPDQAFHRDAVAVTEAWPTSRLGIAWSTAFMPLADPRPTLWIAFKLAVPLPTGPARGTIRFPDGSTLTAPLVTSANSWAWITNQDGTSSARACTATEAEAKLAQSGTRRDPTDCSLTVTGMTMGTTTLLTSRGEATVPAWLYTIAQLTAPITRVAVAPSFWTVPMPGDGRRSDLRAPMYFTSIAGNGVTVTVLGGACDDGDIPLFYEAATAVVVGFTTGAATEFKTQSCILVGIERHLTITLASPLGTRPLLGIDGVPLCDGIQYFDTHP